MCGNTAPLASVSTPPRPPGKSQGSFERYWALSKDKALMSGYSAVLCKYGALLLLLHLFPLLPDRLESHRALSSDKELF